MHNRISRKRQLMLIYALPNIILAIFAVGLAVHEFGWASLVSFPYIILLIWLIYSGIIAGYLRWQEAGEKSESEEIVEKLQELIDEVKKRG